jgi:hypothetical protein
MTATRSTAQTSMSTSTPKNHSVRSEFRHPSVKVGRVVTWQADPWAYLARFLSGPYNRLWPLTGWRRSIVGLRCPICHYENHPSPAKPMVEQDRNGKTYCASCGKEGQLVTADLKGGRVSGPTGSNPLLVLPAGKR